MGKSAMMYLEQEKFVSMGTVCRWGRYFFDIMVKMIST